MPKPVIAGIILLAVILAGCSAYFVAEPTEEATEIVYVTRTGNKYHSADCGALWNTKIPLPLDKAIEYGYTPCQRCQKKLDIANDPEYNK